MNKVYINDFYLGGMGELWHESLSSLIGEALSNLDVDGVEACYLANMSAATLGNQHNLANLVTRELGFDLPVFHVASACASGGLAVSQAYKAIKYGQYQKVLVLGVEKMTDANTGIVAKYLAMALDYETESFLGMTMADAFSLVTVAYLKKYNLSEDLLALWPSLMHEVAVCDTKAHFRKLISADEVKNGRKIAPAIGIYNAAPISDGVAALVLSAEPSAKEILASEFLVSSNFSLASREDLTSFSVLSDLFKRIKSLYSFSVEDLTVLELHDCFTVALAIGLEEIGVVPRGSGLSLLNNGRLSVNPYGGLKAGGHAIGATGVKQVINLCRFLEKEKNEGLGLAVNVGGVGANAALTLVSNSV